MATYKPLQSIALTADTSSVTFSGIDQVYTDLVVVFNGSVSATEDFQIQVNGDTGSNYSRTWLTGNGTSATSNRSSTQTYMRLTQNGYLTTGNSNIIAQFINYSNTTTNKTVLSRSNNAATGVDAIVNLWRSTAAITSIYCYLPSGNFAVGSTFDLYGIKSGAPKALGGDLVTTDGTYWYHTFRTSGTFVLQQPTSVDYLVVAGGGGGGYLLGGGGGAGGMRSTVTATGGSGSLETALSLAPASYTVIVGAGGAVGATSPNPNQAPSGNDSVLATITSTGGGGGGGATGDETRVGANGGSGGGGAGRTGIVGGSASPSGQGFGGGTANGQWGSTEIAGGGGGGASIAGGNASQPNGGNGGNGRATDISGTSVTYAGGGAGFGSGYPSGAGGGTGGTGGGGAGGGVFPGTRNATPGTANTGGGGGGGHSGYAVAAAGGSGIVIVRYAV